MDTKKLYEFIEIAFWFGLAFAAGMVVISIGQDMGALTQDQASGWRLFVLKVIGSLAIFTYGIAVMEWLKGLMVGKEKNEDKASDTSTEAK